jgi:pSer/pThr/pTyr-binding forkhead associated (FHA) protein
VVAHLVRIEAGGGDGGTLPLLDGETLVGRDHGGPLFAEDLYLSPLHATFSFEGGKMSVRNEGSLNGVFVRLKAEAGLVDGDILRLGQEILRFETFADQKEIESADGTRLHGSPEPPAWGRLVEIIAPDDHGNIHMLRDPEVVLGRSCGDITFPDDTFVSGTHCRVSHRGDSAKVADLGSSNGTYLRAKGQVPLDDGDLVLLGQQLFQLRHT